MHHKKSGELVSSFLPGLFCLADAQVRKKPPPALGGGNMDPLSRTLKKDTLCSTQ
jgi:hypothetical protein